MRVFKASLLITFRDSLIFTWSFTIQRLYIGAYYLARLWLAASCLAYSRTQSYCPSAVQVCDDSKAF